MANTFPTSLNNYTGSETLFAAGHAQAHNAYEAKIGTGSSTPVTGTVLTGTGTGTSAWADVDLTTMVTGTLPVANGGTGRATLTSGAVLVGAGTSQVSLYTTSGSGTVIPLLTSPVFVTPTLGVATATSINGLIIDTTTGTLDLTNAKTLAVTASLTLAGTDGKTLTISNSLTLAGTDATVMTFPSTTATIARTDAAQTFTGAQTYSNAVVYTNNAIAASGNAATVPVTARINTVTNNSAATLTITMTTTSAVDRQLTEVLVLDFSAVAQTITWVNTENSTINAPTTSNGSTTLPLTVLFQYNNATSKWRCIAVA